MRGINGCFFGLYFFYSVADHLIEIIVFYHIFKVVFLLPTLKHLAGYFVSWQMRMSGNDGDLMSIGIQLSNLPELMTIQFSFLLAGNALLLAH